MPDRFCPYCGQDNAADYAFCQRCGKALPHAPPEGPAPAAAAPAPAPVTAPPAPPAPPPAPGAVPGPRSEEEIAEMAVAVFERPLSDEERAAIRRSLRRPAVGLARLFGALMALVPILFLITAMMGAPYDPTNYSVIVIVAAALAMGLGIGSLALRGPATVALSRGSAVELRGVPEKQGASGRVALGEVSVEAGPGVSGRLREGRMNALALIPVGRSRSGEAGAARAQVFAVNGALLPRAEPATVAFGAAADLSGLIGIPGGGKGARR